MSDNTNTTDDYMNTNVAVPNNRKKIVKIFVVLFIVAILFGVLYRLQYSPSLIRVTERIEYTITQHADGTNTVLKTHSTIIGNLDIVKWVLFGQEIYIDGEPTITSSQALTWDEFQAGK
jgi:hypothetical protein